MDELVQDTSTQGLENIQTTNDGRKKFNSLSLQHSHRYFRQVGEEATSSKLAINQSDEAPSENRDYVSVLNSNYYCSSMDVPGQSSLVNLKLYIDEIIQSNQKKKCKHPSALICDDE